MTDDRPRFEFRVWGRELVAPTALLNSIAAVAGDSASDETYLVGPEHINTKIRGGQLDIKVRRAVVDGYEHWEPLAKVAAPLEAEFVRERLAPLLGISPARVQRSRYDLDEFVDELIRPEPGVSVIEVSKSRIKFVHDECLAEVAAVTAAGRDLRTLAVESADLPALDDLCRRLGIRGMENCGYPRALREMWTKRG